ncbi:MAG: hypothetical protein FWC72_07335 [Oscillospiraceae bacterium]|nr:hypothetical protein [Oscillospiraceae bacterium]
MKGIKKPCVLVLILLPFVIGILSGCRGDSIASEDSLVGTWRLPQEDSRITDYLVFYEDGSGRTSSVFPDGTYLEDAQLYWEASEGYLTVRILGPFPETIALGYELRNGELVLNFLEDDGSVAETAIFQRISHYLEFRGSAQESDVEPTLGIQEYNVMNLEDLDWTQGVYCVSAQDFIRIEMARWEAEEVLGEGHGNIELGSGIVGGFYYRNRNLNVVFSNDRALRIEILGEGFFVLGLSVGASRQDVLEVLGEPDVTYYGDSMFFMDSITRIDSRLRRLGDERILYGYIAPSNMDANIFVLIDVETDKIVYITVTISEPESTE